MIKSGRPGEQQAADYLQKKGYHILERNYRCLLGEIDIIADDHGTICFVEVKSRTSIAYGTPAAAVNLIKQRRIIRVARYYLLKYQGNEPPCRFDVVAILSAKEPQLIPDAFRI